MGRTRVNGLRGYMQNRLDKIGLNWLDLPNITKIPRKTILRIRDLENCYVLSPQQLAVLAEALEVRTFRLLKEYGFKEYSSWPLITILKKKIVRKSRWLKDTVVGKFS